MIRAGCVFVYLIHFKRMNCPPKSTNTAAERQSCLQTSQRKATFAETPELAIRGDLQAVNQLADMSKERGLRCFQGYRTPCLQCLQESHPFPFYCVVSVYLYLQFKNRYFAKPSAEAFVGLVVKDKQSRYLQGTGNSLVFQCQHRNNEEGENNDCGYNSHIRPGIHMALHTKHHFIREESKLKVFALSAFSKTICKINVFGQNVHNSTSMSITYIPCHDCHSSSVSKE